MASPPKIAGNTTLVNRPYSGVAEMAGRTTPKAPISNITKLSDYLCFAFGMDRAGLSNSRLTSVHSTGRALDVRCKNKDGSWAVYNFEENNWNLINFLYIYRRDLFIEEIHDYVGLYVPGSMVNYSRNRGSSSNWGCGYRCNREINGPVNYPNLTHAPNQPGWIKFTSESSPKDKGERHVHIEVSPAMANIGSSSFERRIASRVTSYCTYDWKTLTFFGRGANSYVKAYTRKGLSI